MTAGKLLPLLPLAILASACAPQPKYYWGDYSSALYDYYTDPTKEGAYEAALHEVTLSESKGKKVPPGLYAEYGYEELTRGNVDEAVEMFGREKQAWPESTVFMDKAIANARTGRKRRAPGTNATPAPKAPTS